MQTRWISRLIGRLALALSASFFLCLATTLSLAAEGSAPASTSGSTRIRVGDPGSGRLTVKDLAIVYGRQCGDNLAGRMIGIRNKTSDRRIRAYYTVTGATNGPSDHNRLIGPGQTAWIICSRPAPAQAMGVTITGQIVE